MFYNNLIQFFIEILRKFLWNYCQHFEIEEKIKNDSKYTFKFR